MAPSARSRPFLWRPPLRKGFPVLVRPLPRVAWWAGRPLRAAREDPTGHGLLAALHASISGLFQSAPFCLFAWQILFPKMAVAGLGQQGILWEGLRGFAVHALGPVTGVPLLCGEHSQWQALGSGPEIQPWLLGF